VAESPSRINWLILRGLLDDGNPAPPTRTFRDGLKVYPLSKADDPPATEFVSMSTGSFNTIHANDITFVDEIDAVIQREPVGVIDPETRGLLAAIGIVKGTCFAPDERMRAIVTESAGVANATARAIAFTTRDPDAYLYPDRWWKAGFIGGDYRWLPDDGNRGRSLDARTSFFYVATVNTPAIALRIPGVGSQYAVTEHDSNGNYLDGATTYEMTLPPDVPANDFWSVVVYDPQTRSELQTPQRFPSKNNVRDPLVGNDDGSITLTFGPTQPSDNTANWTQTVPGKNWFTILRSLRPPRTMVRQDLDPRRHRATHHLDLTAGVSDDELAATAASVGRQTRDRDRCRRTPMARSIWSGTISFG
jgi:hypothetical protein